MILTLIYSFSFVFSRVMLGSAFASSLAGLLSCVSPNFVTLLILRAIVGFGLGGANVFTAWGLEFVRNSSKGIVIIALFASYSIGTSIEASLAWMIIPTYGWRVLCGVSSFPSVLALVFYVSIPESPRYLNKNGRFGEAMDVLHSTDAITETELVESSLNEPFISTAYNALESESSEGERISENIGEIKTNQSLCDTIIWIYTSMTTLFRLLWAACCKITMFVSYFFNHYSYYAIILLTSGSEKLGVTDPNLYKEIFFVIPAELIGLLVAVGMMLSFGRRLSMTAAGVILVLIEIIDQCTIITTSIFITTIALSASFAVIQMYTEEVYPSESHSAGVGIATAAGRFGSLALPLAAAAMTDGKHKTTAIILFAIKIILSGVCALHLPVEAE